MDSIPFTCTGLLCIAISISAIMWLINVYRISRSPVFKQQCQLQGRLLSSRIHPGAILHPKGGAFVLEQYLAAPVKLDPHIEKTSQRFLRRIRQDMGDPLDLLGEKAVHYFAYSGEVAVTYRKLPGGGILIEGLVVCVNKATLTSGN